MATQEQQPGAHEGRAQHVPLTDTVITEPDVNAVLECLQSGWLTMGPRNQALEDALRGHLGVHHVATASSGTAALHLALLAAGIGPGDEVIVPALTFVACASSIRYTGAEPVCCDIRGPHDLNMDVEDASRRITPRTRALLAVHLSGYPADLPALRELCDARGIALVEDCAQALGATVDSTGQKVGTIGDLATFSLSSKQNLCLGEGGLIATADPALDARVRLLRSHAMTSGTWDRHRGHDPTYDVVDIGFNYRLDEPHAALGLSRLSRVEPDIASRRKIVGEYRDRLSRLPALSIPWDERAVQCSSHFAFPVLLADRLARDRLRMELMERGVETAWYPALHELDEYRHCAPPDGLPRAAEAAARSCVLPLSASMDEHAIDVVVDAVRKALSQTA